MNTIGSLLRWGIVLGFALFAPVALPAGGAPEFLITKNFPESSISKLLTNSYCNLYSSPNLTSYSLRSLLPGTPIKVIRSWSSFDGSEWLHIKLDFNSFEISTLPKRGWLKI
tara:strand:+ start:374 stop:709 length:336 start_codon:yes stop_codon:yes gene_type:complete